ncbi:MAG: M1 family metallopeptidase [Chloroflexota bacterium]|jgi:hypothetical protein
MAIRNHLSRSLLLALLAMVLAAGVPNIAQAATRPHYDIQVSLDFTEASLDVVQKTTLRNNTGADLPDLVFHIVPAYFGAFTLKSAKVDGQDVVATRNGTVLEITLNTPLAKGETGEIELRYRIDVPPQGGRFGRGEGVIALGNSFATLAAYQGEWDRHQYVDVGDAFYCEIADFDVTVISDVPVTIASSGRLTRLEGNLQSLSAEGVRDFAMAVSDRYQVESRDIDGVLVSVHATSAGRLGVYLEEAERALRWYSANLGAYPYPTLDIAEIYAADFATAQEYPALIFVYKSLGADGGGIGSYSDYTVAHEMAHQWFYSQVGNDQVRDPWLDEALATYLSILPYREQSPHTFDYYFNRIVNGYKYRVSVGGDRPVNTTVYQYPNDIAYFGIVYNKGAVFLDKLRSLMGDEEFLKLLQDYVATYTGKLATPRAFLDMIYNRVGSDLPPLVDQYFDYGAFAGGEGYQLDVEWPAELAISEDVELRYSSDFQAVEAKVWLDGRLMHQGAGTEAIKFPLEDVEEGEYILRLDMLDEEGALYQQARRVKVVNGQIANPTLSPWEMEVGDPISQGESGPVSFASPWGMFKAMERELYTASSIL